MCRNGRTSLKRWSSCRSSATPTRSSTRAATWKSTQHGYVSCQSVGLTSLLTRKSSPSPAYFIHMRTWWPAELHQTSVRLCGCRGICNRMISISNHSSQTRARRYFIHRDADAQHFITVCIYQITAVSVLFTGFNDTKYNKVFCIFKDKVSFQTKSGFSAVHELWGGSFPAKCNMYIESIRSIEAELLCSARSDQPISWFSSLNRLSPSK